MFRVGEFSRIAQVSVRLLHYYDEIGLLPPAYVDGQTNYRYYSIEQLADLNRILALRDLGLSLEEIQQCVLKQVGPDDLAALLEEQRAKAEQTILAEQRRLAKIEAHLRQLNADHTTLDVVFKPIPPQTALTIRKKASGREMMDVMFDAHSATRHIEHLRGHAFAIFYDQENQMPFFDFEFGFVMEDDTPEAVPLSDGDWLAKTVIPGAELAACCVYGGPFINLFEGYQEIGRSLAAQGYTTFGATREIFWRLYHPDHADQNITEIQIPLLV